MFSKYLAKLSKFYWYILPAAIFIFFLLIAFAFDKTPPNWDAGRHFFNTAKLADIF